MPRDDMLFPKTIHDVKTSRDITRRPRTTSQQAFRKRQLVYQVAPADQAEIAIELQREQRRFRKQTESLERTRKRIERARAKLYSTYEKNRAIMGLRYQLQKERWASLGPGGSGIQEPSEPSSARTAFTRRVRTVRLRRS